MKGDPQIKLSYLSKLGETEFKAFEKNMETLAFFALPSRENKALGF